MLPNTMACTFTAVPHSSGMLFSSRYLMARGVFHDLNTASMPPQI